MARVKKTGAAKLPPDGADANGKPTWQGEPHAPPPENPSPPPEPQPNPPVTVYVADVVSDADDGSRLIAELEIADKQADVSNARAAMFESANAPKEIPIDARVPRLVERTFAPLDWNDVLNRFDKWMSLGDRRTDEQHVRKAHEEGPSIVSDVFRSMVQVRYAREAWELENDTLLGAMREEAQKVLEREKERKVRTKMITEADVSGKCASMFPDEWATQEKKRLQFKLVEDRMKHCSELGTLRCRILDSMMARLR